MLKIGFPEVAIGIPDQQVQDILHEPKAKQWRVWIHTRIEWLLDYSNSQFAPDGVF